MSEALAAFRTAYRAGHERVNQHDFEGAFAGLSEAAEWHPMDVWKSMGGVVRGRAELVRVYRKLLQEFPNWHVDAEEFIELGDGVFAVRSVARAEGRSSGAPVEQRFTQVWEFGASGEAERVREFEGDPTLSELESRL